MKKAPIFLAILTVATSNVVAAPTGAAFLKIPVDARGVGLGNAYTALTNDAASAYLNPAGLACASRINMTASHNVLFAGMQQSFVGTGFNAFGRLGIGVNILTFDSGAIDGRDAQGNPTGDFKAQDKAIGVAAAWRFSDSLSFGGGIKSIKQQIADVTASGQALDLGVQMRLGKKLSLGTALRNLGSDMTFIAEPYSLPTALHAGAALNITPSVTFATEARLPLNDDNAKPEFATGIEYNLLNLSRSYFWAPVVWRFGYLTPNTPGVGFGLKLLGSQLDYALAPMPDLGVTHRITMRLAF